MKEIIIIGLVLIIFTKPKNGIVILIEVLILIGKVYIINCEIEKYHSFNNVT